MATGLITLPTELRDKILGLLEPADHISLLNTCHGLRGMAAPLVFQTVSFIAGGIGNITGRALYGHLVKEVRVNVPHPVCIDYDCPWCRWGNNPERDYGHDGAITNSTLDKQNLWLTPDAVTLLAADRTMLPNMTRLVLHFSESLMSHHGDFRPINDNPAYQEFLRQLQDIFFKHLSAVRRLRFESPESSPLGIRSMDEAKNQKIATAPTLRRSRPDLPVFEYSVDCVGGPCLCETEAQNAWAFVEGHDQAAWLIGNY
ncbi:uncharacterized protein PgNI_07947 [Pyricularia grisea]|uniref:F-box domain-containing protein n=1 Tax=Pyricularia grisea TaxID=148305 RepID=A0A6P8B136_PYRGI|nr:uncharacterized protein PgNI_07947 [Pyricularia grisea]TLD08546.1 hypothetical protein PgNI_07947 [Pyricularia grisea]